MFRLLYEAIFRLQLKRCIDIQLAMSSKYEIWFTLEYKLIYILLTIVLIYGHFINCFINIYKF